MNLMLPGNPFSSPKPQPLPEPVDRAAIAEEAAQQRAEELRKRRGRQASILTSPSGVGDDGNLQRPTLLGQ